MMNTWTQEEARSRFDSLLENALHHHEQIIQLSNHRKVVVIALEDYLPQRRKPLNLWLLDNLHGLGELTLPDRHEPEREIPFQ